MIYFFIGSKIFISKDKQELLEALRLVLQGKNVEIAKENHLQKNTKKVVDRDVENENVSDNEEAKRNKMP